MEAFKFIKQINEPSVEDCFDLYFNSPPHSLEKVQAVTQLRLNGMRFGFSPQERPVAYPILMKFSYDYIRSPLMNESRFSHQIGLDLHRTVSNRDLSSELEALLNTLIEQNPSLHYYQGLNDVSQFFLECLPVESAIKAMEYILSHHLAPFAYKDMTYTQFMLLWIMEVIKKVKPSLFHRFNLSHFEPLKKGYFCLSWVISWFLHDCNHPLVIDAIVSAPPSYIVYLAAAYTIKLVEKNLPPPKLEEDTDPEWYNDLVKSPENFLPNNYRSVLDYAFEIMQDHPPASFSEEFPQIFEAYPLMLNPLREKVVFNTTPAAMLTLASAGLVVTGAKLLHDFINNK